MDKYEYKVRAEEIKTLIARGEYVQAVEIADMIDWRRVKSVMMLCTISDLYKINRRFEDARDMLLLAYDRHPGGRTIVYSLCELSIKMEEFVQAVEYYKEFVQIAPKDSGRYILQYKLYEVQEVGLEERIAVLEELKKRDYREKWAYELAYLYHRVGLSTRCVEECDELILWFGEGKYVVKAMELKMLHQPLTPDQQKKYDNRFEENVGYVGKSAVSADSQDGYEGASYRDGGYEGGAGYGVESYGEAAYDTGARYADASEYGGNPGYGEPSAYGGEAGYGESSAYGEEPGYGEPSAYGGEPGYGEPSTYGGEPGYGEPSAYGGESGYGDSSAYGEAPDYGGDSGYGENSGYSRNTGYGEASLYEENAGYYENTEAGQDGYGTVFYEDSDEEESGYEGAEKAGGRSYEKNGGFESGGYMGRPSGEPEELDIQVKTMNVGQYDTINLQKELAEGLKEVLGASENESNFMRPEPFPGELSEHGPELEEIQESEVFFGETGELEDLDSRPGTLSETVQEAARTGGGTQDALGIVRDTAGIVMEELRRENLENSAIQTRQIQDKPQEQSYGGKIQAKKPEAAILRPESSEPPRELADVLAMESDGQISLVVPEQDIIEKQITGQLSIEDILSEWERMKKNNEEKRKEAVRQKVLEHTGSMFTEFEASVRDGLLEKLEGGRENDESQENVLNFRRQEKDAGQEMQAVEGQADELQSPWNRAEMAGTDNSGGAGTGQEPGTFDSGAGEWTMDSEEAGLSAEESEDFGLSAEESEESGLSYEDSEEAGLSAEELEELGLNYEDSEKLGLSAEESEESGLSYEDFEELGLSAEESEESGLSYGDSEELGLSAEESEESGLSYEELGLSAEELEELGLSYKDSEELGLSAEESEESGLSYEDSEELGLSAEELKGLGLKYEDAEELGLSAGELEGLGLRYKKPEETGFSDEKQNKSGLAYQESEKSGFSDQELEEARLVYENLINSYTDSGLQDAEREASQNSGDSEASQEAHENVSSAGTQSKDNSGRRQEQNRAGAAPETDSSMQESGKEPGQASAQEDGKDGTADEKPDSGTGKGTKTAGIAEESKPVRTAGNGKTAGTEEGKDAHSAQDRPAQPDKTRIRGLTKEERELFGPYIQNKSSRERLVTAIDNISLAAYTGNVIVTGEEGMDTMTLAKNLIRKVQMNDSNFSGKIAKISGAALNAKDPETILNQLKNGALIIQKASGMDEKTAKALYKGLSQESFGIIVVLEDNKKAVNRFLEKYPGLAGCFNARMDVEALSNDTLAAFGRKYARELEFSIDELGMLALHTRIEDLQTSDHIVTVLDVKEIVDEAIRKASKKTFGHFFDILLAKRYDEEDMIILREKDFV